MLNRYLLARVLGGLLGFGAGYLAWQTLRNAMLLEIPADAWKAATASDALVTLISIAAVALIMTPGLVLSAGAEQVTKQVSRFVPRRVGAEQHPSS